jgi:hypothetical protein
VSDALSGVEAGNNGKRPGGGPNLGLAVVDEPLGTKTAARTLFRMTNQSLPATAFKSPAIALLTTKCTRNSERSLTTLQTRMSSS